ncbi:MAG: hypothetical protein WDN50_04985 [Bradyrhizobium sp.]
MTSFGGNTGSISRHRLPARRWSRLLQAAAIALSVMVLSTGTVVEAAPASTAHVYLLRGVLNIFSMGLDDIAAKLEAQGIPVTVTNYLGWASLAERAAADYKSGKVRTIILVGHSSGATVLPDMVARLDQLGAPVKLAIGLDSVFRTSLHGRVGRYINFYIANGNGEPVKPTSNLHGTLENVNVQDVPGVRHLNIEKNEIMQRKVISAIDAVALGR